MKWKKIVSRKLTAKKMNESVGGQNVIEMSDSEISKFKQLIDRDLSDLAQKMDEKTALKQATDLALQHLEWLTDGDPLNPDPRKNTIAWFDKDFEDEDDEDAEPGAHREMTVPEFVEYVYGEWYAPIQESSDDIDMDDFNPRREIWDAVDRLEDIKSDLGKVWTFFKKTGEEKYQYEIEDILSLYRKVIFQLNEYADEIEADY